MQNQENKLLTKSHNTHNILRIYLISQIGRLFHQVVFVPRPHHVRLGYEGHLGFQVVLLPSKDSSLSLGDLETPAEDPHLLPCLVALTPYLQCDDKNNNNEIESIWIFVFRILLVLFSLFS